MHFIDGALNFVNLYVLQIALAASFVLYFVYGRLDELSRNAAQNTAATLMVYGLNLYVGVAYVHDLNAGAQWIYDQLHIPHIDPAIWENAPIWLICVVGLVAVDFCDYWSHRLMHTRWGWPTHAAHHSDTHVNAFTALRIHALEAFVMTTSYLVLLTWLQIPAALPVVIAVALLHNMYVHMDLEWDHGRFKYLVASPVFHRWHHADVPEAYGKNLANLMPLWDKLFGTYHENGVFRGQMGALSSGVEDKNPILIYIYPFREWARLTQQALTRPRRENAPAEAPETQAAARQSG